MCSFTKFKKTNKPQEELMYVFNKYQEVMKHFDDTEEANDVIRDWQKRYPHATLGWIYNKVLFDLQKKN